MRPRTQVRGSDAVGMLDALLAHACQRHVSDIHMQPLRDGVVIRFRIDGILQDHQFVSRSEGTGVLTRLKVLMHADVSQAQHPQDGAFRMSYNNVSYDIRVSLFPSLYGEKAVLRLLCAEHGASTLSDLGLPAPLVAQLEQIVEMNQGFFIVTGPTGSGKTTTLYAMLQAIDRTARNVITLEDPIEYRIDRVTQTQIDPASGFHFADAMRSLLRQDPDVALIGEMRDRQTAQSAVEAALTGHLVLSSLHTTHASAAAIRLREIGVEPYLIASSLTGVLAQRLVPLLCTECKVEVAADDAQLAWARRFGVYMTGQWRAAGCAACSFQGRKGRTVIAELFTPDDLAREAMSNSQTTMGDLHAHAKRCGLQPLGAYGLELAEKGLICLTDLMRLGV